MSVLQMDPLLVWKSIEGYQNELASEREKLEAFYRQFTCLKKNCRASCRKETLPKHAFGTGPEFEGIRSVLRCTACNCLFDPHTGLILEMGTDPTLPPGIPLIEPK
jgi:hypothetical protein